MQIDKFSNDSFGTLTTITSNETGIVMFMAKEVCDIWGHKNPTQAIKDAGLTSHEYKVIKLKKYPVFKNQLTKSGLVGARASDITMITEGGMWKLALASNLEKAKPFKDWVTSEVLPSIRQKGYYSIADQSKAILIHTSTSVQKQNSKDINKKNLIENGVESVINYNRTSCILHTGRSTKEIKEYGKKIGLKSSDRTSAKEVLRHTKPELACAMSFTDSLVQKGFDLKTVSELSLKCAVPLFQGMIELGIKPEELNK